MLGEKQMENNKVSFDKVEASFFLIGLLSEFNNRLQKAGDNFFKEISWKQCFLLICIKLFEKPPTLKELSDTVGSSHQNVKQLLLKLEKKGFIEMVSDTEDKRKQRIVMTERAKQFDEAYNEPSSKFVENLYKNVKKEELLITIKTIMQMDENLKEMDK